MHPIERLRYVSRAGWAGPAALGAEAAFALADLAEHEPAAMLPACRRLLERNPSCGPLWWVAARVLTGGDCFDEAELCAAILEDDPTEEILEEAEADGRRIVRHGGVAEVATADVVAVDVDAMGPTGMVLSGPDTALLLAAEELGVEVWAVAGVGRVMPTRLWQVAVRLMEGRPETRVQVASPFFDMPEPPTAAGVVAVTNVNRVAGPRGPRLLAEALRVVDFPEPPELANAW